MTKCPLCDEEVEALITYGGEEMCTLCEIAIRDEEAQHEQEFQDSLDYLYDGDGR